MDMRQGIESILMRKKMEDQHAQGPGSSNDFLNECHLTGQQSRVRREKSQKQRPKANTAMDAVSRAHKWVPVFGHGMKPAKH